jgi:hypothetical protein
VAIDLADGAGNGCVLRKATCGRSYANNLARSSPVSGAMIGAGLFAGVASASALATDVHVVDLHDQASG